MRNAKCIAGRMLNGSVYTQPYNKGTLPVEKIILMSMTSHSLETAIKLEGHPDKPSSSIL